MPDRPSGGEISARLGHGRVLCQDISQLADAANAANAIDAYYTLAGQCLGFARDKDVEIWLVPNHPVKATTYEDFIAFDSSPEVMPYADLILTHEFVHWHAHDTVMQRNLPHVIGEGLAERIAADLTDRWKQEREDLYDGLIAAARERGDLPRIISVLDLSSGEYLHLPVEDKHDTCALGFVLVSRIGVDVLREEAQKGPVSSETLLNMACVTSEGDGL